MTLYEVVSTALAAISLVLVLVGLVFVCIQISGARRELKTLNRHQAENHDWHRRVAAQEALSKFNYSILSSPLQVSFDFLNLNDPIPIQSIEEELKKNPNLQNELHELLNYYEGLARGINQGILDETVVKTGRRTEVERCEKAFREYIFKRRGFNPRAWRQLTNIAERWRSENTLVEIRSPADATAGSRLKP